MSDVTNLSIEELKNIDMKILTNYHWRYSGWYCKSEEGRKRNISWFDVPTELDIINHLNGKLIEEKVTIYISPGDNMLSGKRNKK